MMLAGARAAHSRPLVMWGQLCVLLALAAAAAAAAAAAPQGRTFVYTRGAIGETLTPPTAPLPPPSTPPPTPPPPPQPTLPPPPPGAPNDVRQAARPVHERFPHAVLFARTCGGSIISPTWVLTAAHCTLFTGGHDVVAGTSRSDDGSGVRARVRRLVIHPRFTVGPYWLNPGAFNITQVAARFDFLLVELETPLPLDGRSVAAVALPDAAPVPPGTDVTYAGYGAEKHGETMRPDMHAMELQTVADAACARRLEQFAAQDMLCAKGKPPRFDSACNGDSGSGLWDGRRLLGVASWVEDDALTCRPGALVVFSRVARVRDWIRTVTGV